VKANIKYPAEGWADVFFFNKRKSLSVDSMAKYKLREKEFCGGNHKFEAIF
jgi:hypothetical protein